MESRSSCAVESRGGVKRDRAPIGTMCAGQALSIALTSDAHSYEKPDRYSLVVIFGNDT